MEAVREENRFKAESAIVAMNSLLDELGPYPRENLEAILRRTCELLEGKCAVYASTENDTGRVGIRRAYNLTPSLSAAWGLSCTICSRIIYSAGQEPVWTFYFPEMSRGPIARSSDGLVLKSAIGYPIKLGAKKKAAIAVLCSQARDFDEEDRLLVAVSGMLAVVQELWRPHSEALGNWNKVCQRFTPTEAKVADLVRQGKVSKEIARDLNLALRSVEFHRYNIRKKLGVRNLKINLRQYLTLNG